MDARKCIKVNRVSLEEGEGADDISLMSEEDIHVQTRSHLNVSLY